jgi:uncharacterized protein (UPF0332 family)
MNLKKINPDFNQIELWLVQAKKDLATASKNLQIDPHWALVIAYQVMLKIGLALMFGFGVKPSGLGQHKTVVEFTAVKLGKQFIDITNQFERLRRKRHDFFYGHLIGISLIEAQTAIKAAKKLLKEVRKIINSRNPQKKLL